MLASWTDEWMNTGGKALSTRSQQYHAGLPMRGACSFYKPHWIQRGKGKKMFTGEKVGRRWGEGGMAGYFLSIDYALGI